MKNLGLMFIAFYLAACAETRVSTVEPTMAEAPAQEASAAIRLRMEAPEEPMQQAAFDSLKGLLVEARYHVVKADDDTYDVDMMIRSREGAEGASKRTTITLVSRVGRRVMDPLSAAFVSDDGTLDESSLVEIWQRWQRRFARGEQAGKHQRQEPFAARRAAGMTDGQAAK